MDVPVKVVDLFRQAEPLPLIPKRDGASGVLDSAMIRRVMEKTLNSAYDSVGNRYPEVHRDEYDERVRCVRQATAWTPILVPGLSGLDRPMTLRVKPSVYDVETGLVHSEADARVLAGLLPDHVVWARFIPFPGRS